MTDNAQQCPHCNGDKIELSLELGDRRFYTCAACGLTFPEKNMIEKSQVSALPSDK